MIKRKDQERGERDLRAGSDGGCSSDQEKISRVKRGVVEWCGQPKREVKTKNVRE